MSTITHAAFRSQALVDAFTHAAKQLRAEHAVLLKRIKKSRTRNAYVVQEEMNEQETNAKFESGFTYIDEINAQLATAKTSDAQLAVLNTQVEQCFYDIVHNIRAARGYETLIRCFELANDRMHETHPGDDDHPWDVPLTNLMAKAHMNYNAYEALCDMAIADQRLRGVKAKEIMDNVSDWARVCLFSEHPDVHARDMVPGINDDAVDKKTDDLVIE
jgi:hypothetical protein